MDKPTLENYIKEGYTGCEIAKLTNLGRTTIYYWLDKFGLKTDPNSIWYDLPWHQIQEAYDNNGTYRSIKKQFKLHPRCLTWAKAIGLIKFRTHKESMKLSSKLGRSSGAKFWSQELRDRARQRMIARIEQDPNNHPNRKLANNKTKMSYPERLVFDFLVSKNIKFEHNKYIKPYWVDFCIDNIIIEVDGKRWHNKERDEIRDKNLNKIGYTVYRFPAKIILKTPSIVNSVINFNAPVARID